MSERTPSSIRTLLVGLGVLVLIGLVVFGLRVALRDTPSVRSSTAIRANMSSSISTNGKVEPVEDFQAHATTSGVVQRISARVGQHVASGAELLRMDDSDARKNVATAQASLQMAQATLSNMKGGGSADELLTSNADLVGVRTQRQQDAATLASREALLSRGSASASEVAQARQKLADDDARLAQLQTRRQGRYSSGDIAAQQAQVAQARAALSAAQSAYASVDFRAPLRRHRLLRARLQL